MRSREDACDGNLLRQFRRLLEPPEPRDDLGEQGTVGGRRGGGADLVERRGEARSCCSAAGVSPASSSIWAPTNDWLARRKRRPNSSYVAAASRNRRARLVEVAAHREQPGEAVLIDPRSGESSPSSSRRSWMRAIASSTGVGPWRSACA